MINALTKRMAGFGIGRIEILATRGRRSGVSRQTPVSPITVEGAEYLVSPYGEVGWVHNLRADSTATLRHGSTERRVRVEEVAGSQAAHVVAVYHSREPFARRYMDVPEHPTADDFAVAPHRFPVFRVIGL